MNSPQIAFVPVCRSVCVDSVCLCLSFPLYLSVSLDCSFFFPQLTFFPLSSSIFCLVQVPQYLFVYQRGGSKMPQNQHLHHGKVKASTETQIKDNALDVVIQQLL